MRINAILKKTWLFSAPVVFIITVMLFIPGCMPTYPKEKLPEMVKSVCKIEYDMDVNVTVVGSTIGIYYPMNGLLDVGMGISEEAWEKISNLILIASRVVLSTDADIKFYCVITQDARLPELQVVIIKYVEDIKHSMYSNISRDESLKRTLFSINLTPQAKKERSIETVFEKLGVEEETKQKVLDEFFRSPPTKLSDVGYWRENFYLKDITLEEFLAAQIANRVKIEFRAAKNLSKIFEYKNSEGVFVSDKGSRAFVIKFKIDDQATGDTAGGDLKAKKIQEIMSVANEVVTGYKFEAFDYLFMDDQQENARLSATENDVYNFNRNRTSVDKIVKVQAGYFN